MQDRLDPEIRLVIHLCGPSPNVSEVEVAHEPDEDGFDALADVTATGVAHDEPFVAAAPGFGSMGT